jgi:hypothetical protein
MGALVVAAAVLTACSETSTAPSAASTLSSQPTFALGDALGDVLPAGATAVVGKVIICKTGNAGGTFAVTMTPGAGGTGGGTAQNPATVANGTCQVVGLDNGDANQDKGDIYHVSENAAANTVQTLVSCVLAGAGAQNCATVNNNYFTNTAHGWVITYNNQFTQPTGTLQVCKVAGSGVTVGTNYSFTANGGTAFQVAAGAGPTGTCGSGGTFNVGTAVTVQETVPAGVTVSSIVGGTPDVANGRTVITIAAGTNTVTFTNTIPAPPRVCDFITFGRLVTEVGGNKVIISGNAGGNQPGGGILAEFHVEVNGVDNHVADVATYGPIASGVFSGPNFPNSRITTGTAKNGNTVELRLWDGGEPGKGTDWVYVKINGVAVLGAGGQTIDQGNMQYHANCRGPGE